jgi:hypothetical protein
LQFGFTADETLKIVQTCTNKKWSPIPELTPLLPNDAYPKVWDSEKS